MTVDGCVLDPLESALLSCFVVGDVCVLASVDCEISLEVVVGDGVDGDVII